MAGHAEAHYIDLMPHNPLGPICTGQSHTLCLLHARARARVRVVPLASSLHVWPY